MFTPMSKAVILSLLVGAGIFTACKKNDDDMPSDEYASEKSAIKETYASIVSANYEDAYNDAITLQTKIDAFLDAPSESLFEDAKDAWLQARESYGTTEAFRFANGPIDDEDGPEGLLNAWPLDEAYIDYVEGGSATSIIFDTATYPSITAELLESLNEDGGEENISIGYHAIEFLLWGQDLTAPSEKLAGQRPYTDYADGGTSSFQERRRQYLSVATSLLIDHLKLMVDEWSASSVTSNYRTTFLASDNDEALTDILTAIGILSKSELAGERVFTAYDNQDQEDEHSCFSDNTHRDIILNTQGVVNVYLGSYTRTDGSVVSGTSIHDLVMMIDAEKSATVNTQLLDALAQTKAIENPFDLAISDASFRPQVLTAVTSLRTLGDEFAEVATTLGLSISTDLPD